MKNNDFSQNQERLEQSSEVTCPNCFGSGEVKPQDTIGQPRVQEYIPCRICGGNGKIPNIRK